MALPKGVSSVVESDIDQSYETDHSWDIHAAIVTDDIDLLRQTVKLGNVVNEKFAEDVSIDHAGMTPLSLACALNKLPAVKLLLAYGADVNTTFTDLKTTSLMTSSFHGHSEIVRVLLKKGANVQALDQQGSTALGYAFGGSKCIDVISQLLAAGIDVNRRNMLGMTALLLVAGYGDDRLVQMVLDAGADATAVNNFGHTALHLAIVGKRALVKKLAAAPSGANPAVTMYDLNRRDIDSALVDWARTHCGAPHAEHAEELERVGKFMMMIGSRIEGGDSDNEQETMKRRVEAVLRYRQDKMLLQRDRTKSGIIDKILSCGSKRGAAAARHPANSPAPAPRPPPIMPTDSYTGATAGNAKNESDALIDRCTRILHLVIDAGCPINAMETAFGLTALDMSILLGDIESTALLVCAGADADHLTKMFASSELYDAIVAVERKRVKELLAYDVDLDVNQPFCKFNIRRPRPGGSGEQDPSSKDYKYEGLTPLTVAAQLTVVDVLDIIRLLQKHNADVNKVGPGGSSPLAEAARIGSLKMVQFLTAQGADLEVVNPAYMNATAVVVAVINKCMTVVDFLIEAGAKLDRPLSDGRTSLIKAMQNGDKTMAERLLQANLGRNYIDTRGFMYEMAQKYQRLSVGGLDTIMKMITNKVEEIARKESGEADAKNRSVSRITTPLPVMTSTAVKNISKPCKDPNVSVNSQKDPVAKKRRARVKQRSSDKPKIVLPDEARHASLLALPVHKQNTMPTVRNHADNDGVEHLSLYGTDTLDERSDTDSNYQASLKRWPATSLDQGSSSILEVVEAPETPTRDNQKWPAMAAEPVKAGRKKKRTSQKEAANGKQAISDAGSNDGKGLEEKKGVDNSSAAGLSDGPKPEEGDAPQENKSVDPEHPVDVTDSADAPPAANNNETESVENRRSVNSVSSMFKSIPSPLDSLRYVSKLPSPLSPLKAPPPLPDTAPPEDSADSDADGDESTLDEETFEKEIESFSAKTIETASAETKNIKSTHVVVTQTTVTKTIATTSSDVTNSGVRLPAKNIATVEELEDSSSSSEDCDDDSEHDANSPSFRYSVSQAAQRVESLQSSTAADI